MVLSLLQVTTMLVVSQKYQALQNVECIARTEYDT